jgi:hypothetical protein
VEKNDAEINGIFKKDLYMNNNEIIFSVCNRLTKYEGIDYMIELAKDNKIFENNNNDFEKITNLNDAYKNIKSFVTTNFILNYENIDKLRTEIENFYIKNRDMEYLTLIKIWESLFYINKKMNFSNDIFVEICAKIFHEHPKNIKLFFVGDRNYKKNLYLMEQKFFFEFKTNERLRIINKEIKYDADDEYFDHKNPGIKKISDIINSNEKIKNLYYEMVGKKYIKNHGLSLEYKKITYDEIYFNIGKPYLSILLEKVRKNSKKYKLIKALILSTKNIKPEPLIDPNPIYEENIKFLIPIENFSFNFTDKILGDTKKISDENIHKLDDLTILNYYKSKLDEDYQIERIQYFVTHLIRPELVKKYKSLKNKENELLLEKYKKSDIYYEFGNHKPYINYKFLCDPIKFNYDKYFNKNYTHLKSVLSEYMKNYSGGNINILNVEKILSYYSVVKYCELNKIKNNYINSENIISILKGNFSDAKIENTEFLCGDCPDYDECDLLMSFYKNMVHMKKFINNKCIIRFIELILRRKSSKYFKNQIGTKKIKGNFKFINNKNLKSSDKLINIILGYNKSNLFSVISEIVKISADYYNECEKYMIETENINMQKLYVYRKLLLLGNNEMKIFLSGTNEKFYEYNYSRNNDHKIFDTNDNFQKFRTDNNNVVFSYEPNYMKTIFTLLYDYKFLTVEEIIKYVLMLVRYLYSVDSNNELGEFLILFSFLGKIDVEKKREFDKQNFVINCYFIKETKYRGIGYLEGSDILNELKHLPCNLLHHINISEFKIKLLNIFALLFINHSDYIKKIPEKKIKCFMMLYDELKKMIKPKYLCDLSKYFVYKKILMDKIERENTKSSIYYGGIISSYSYVDYINKRDEKYSYYYNKYLENNKNIKSLKNLSNEIIYTFDKKGIAIIFKKNKLYYRNDYEFNNLKLIKYMYGKIQDCPQIIGIEKIPSLCKNYYKNDLNLVFDDITVVRKSNGEVTKICKKDNGKNNLEFLLFHIYHNFGKKNTINLITSIINEIINRCFKKIELPKIVDTLVCPHKKVIRPDGIPECVEPIKSGHFQCNDTRFPHLISVNGFGLCVNDENKMEKILYTPIYTNYLNNSKILQNLQLYKSLNLDLNQINKLKNIYKSYSVKDLVTKIGEDPELNQYKNLLSSINQNVLDVVYSRAALIRYQKENFGKISMKDAMRFFK